MLLALALSAAATLAGCQTSGNLPPLSASLVAKCSDPGVRAGKPALTELARNRLALAECSHKHRDIVSFYQDLERRHH